MREEVVLVSANARPLSVWKTRHRPQQKRENGVIALKNDSASDAGLLPRGWALGAVSAGDGMTADSHWNFDVVYRSDIEA